MVSIFVKGKLKIGIDNLTRYDIMIDKGGGTMNRKQLITYIKNALYEQDLTYREFTEVTKPYVPGGIGRQSLTHWTKGKHLPNMSMMAMIYFRADPQTWLFEFARRVMLAVIDIKTQEMEAK